MIEEWGEVLGDERPWLVEGIADQRRDSQSQECSQSRGKAGAEPPFPRPEGREDQDHGVQEILGQERHQRIHGC